MAIYNGNINRVIIVTDEELSEILVASGVEDDDNKAKNITSLSKKAIMVILMVTGIWTLILYL